MSKPLEDNEFELFSVVLTGPGANGRGVYMLVGRYDDLRVAKPVFDATMMHILDPIFNLAVLERCVYDQNWRGGGIQPSYRETLHETRK